MNMIAKRLLELARPDIGFNLVNPLGNLKVIGLNTADFGFLLAKMH